MSTENTAPTPSIESSESIETPETPTESTTEALAAQPEGEATQAQAKAQAKLEKQLKKLKLKVDGQELEEEFDPSDDAYLTKQLQLAKVAQKRMSEFSSLEKDVQQFFKALKENPRAVLTDPQIGLDLKQLAAQIIEEEIENAKKSPEQLEKEKLERELKAMKDEREKEKKENEEKELRRLEEREAERYDVLFTQALEKGGLPKTPYTVKKMAEYLSLGIGEGLDVAPDDVIPLIREEMQADLKEMFKSMPDELVEQLVGTETISRIRKKKVAAAKAAPTPVKSSIKDTGKTSTQKTEPQKKVSIKDFFGVQQVWRR